MRHTKRKRVYTKRAQYWETVGAKRSAHKKPAMLKQNSKAATIIHNLHTGGLDLRHLGKDDIDYIGESLKLMKARMERKKLEVIDLQDAIAAVERINKI